METPPCMNASTNVSTNNGPTNASTNGTLASLPNRQEAIQVVRDAVLADVDAKVAEKVDELWRRGQQAIAKMDERHKEKANKLTDEIARMTERQHQLEHENEQLKQNIQTLAGRFQLLGVVFGGNAAAKPAAPPGIDTPFTPLPPSVADSPLRSGSTAIGGGEEAEDKPLPHVPGFPFGTASVPEHLVAAAAAAAARAAAAAPTSTPGTTGTTTPLSLADALGTPQQRKPLSLVSSLTPPPASEGQASRMTFSFTIRKADDADLGLNVSHDPTDQVLRVEDIRTSGAVESWNRQCMNSNTKDKAVRPGDRIISVNDVSFAPSKMLEECKHKKTLKLTIVRGGDGPLGESVGTADDAAPATTAAATVLRGDAPVFVPSGVSAEVAEVAQRESSSEAQDTDAGGCVGKPGNES